jgi:hypothetical protein
VSISWTESYRKLPPPKRRLFLIVSAQGNNSEVVIGYFTGDHYRSMTVDYSDSGTKLDVTHWALIEDYLPTKVTLRPSAHF